VRRPLFSGLTASAGFSVQVRVDGTLACTATAGSIGDWSCQPSVDLIEGSHQAAVVAIDLAGNSSAAATVQFSVDVTAPVVAISAGPAASTTATDAQLSFNCGADLCLFECSLDGVAFDACDSPKSYTGLGLGAHTFGVRGFDTAGNMSAAVNRTWTVTLTPVDAGTPDAGTPADAGNDAGSETDAGTAVDAGTEPDAGTQPVVDAGTGGGGGGGGSGGGLEPAGCGCTTGADGALLWLALALIAPLRNRLRRK
jgi:MYXO-CTERM domain-containing protein